MNRLYVFTSLMMIALAGGRPPRAAADLLVTSHETNSVLRYDETTGAFLGAFVPSGSGGLTAPHGLDYGPDGNLYVTGHRSADGTVNDVFRYDGQTGAFLNRFVAAGSGGLNFSSDLEFGPDGNLYVASYLNNQVRKFDGRTGSFLMAFTGNGLNGSNGLAFGPDGNLYVSNQLSDSVARFNPITGASLGTFVAAGAGGLNVPEDLTFGPDGNLYVTSLLTNSVLRYDGVTGNFLGAFVTPGSGGLNGPLGLNFGPDGNLYVSSADSDRILRYNGTTGAFLGTFVTPGSGGLDFPHFLTFTPRPVPEPTTLALLGVGALGLLLHVRRDGKRKMAGMNVAWRSR